MAYTHEIPLNIIGLYVVLISYYLFFNRHNFVTDFKKCFLTNINFKVLLVSFLVRLTSFYIVYNIFIVILSFSRYYYGNV